MTFRVAVFPIIRRRDARRGSRRVDLWRIWDAVAKRKQCAPQDLDVARHDDKSYGEEYDGTQHPCNPPRTRARRAVIHFWRKKHAFIVDHVRVVSRRQRWRYWSCVHVYGHVYIYVCVRIFRIAPSILCWLIGCLHKTSTHQFVCGAHKYMDQHASLDIIRFF